MLDNFEHVVAAAPALAALLVDVPGLKALVTSRAALRLSGEHIVVVAPLAVPDPTTVLPATQLMQYAAVRLFVERAQAVAARFRLTDTNAAAVAAICARLDGLPLAVELAAARIKLLPPQALLKRLGSRLKLLTGGARDLHERQQTLRNTIDWSYELLDAGEQALFARLGVFVGGCTLEAAEAVCAADGDLRVDIVDGIAALLNQSLVRQEEEIDGEPRFVMLETIREYALERLQMSGEIAAMQRRHAEYYTALAEAAEPRLRQPAQMARLRIDHDNLRAALGWALGPATELAARISAVLWRYWEGCNLLSEGRAWLTAVLARRDELPEPVRAKALWAAGEITENLAEQVALFEESLRLFRALGDLAGIAEVVGDLGGVAQDRGDYALARTYYDEKLALCRERGDQGGEIRSLIRLGSLATDEGNFPQAAALYQEALALAHAIDDSHGVARATVGLGVVAQRRGVPDLAAAHYTEGLALLRELEQNGLTVHPLLYLADLALQQGDLAGAAARYTECLELIVEQSEHWWAADCLVGFAQIAGACGELERAVRLSGAAAAQFDVIEVTPTFTDRANLDRLASVWRAQIGEDVFMVAWAQGRTLPLDQAIAEAQTVADAVNS
jgi:predicted ATPase